LTKLRAEWSLKEDECILMSEQSRRFKQAYEGEMVRLDVLLQCYRDVKSQFMDLSTRNNNNSQSNQSHDDGVSSGSSFWAKDVFIDATGLPIIIIISYDGCFLLNRNHKVWILLFNFTSRAFSTSYSPI